MSKGKSPYLCTRFRPEMERKANKRAIFGRNYIKRQRRSSTRSVRRIRSAKVGLDVVGRVAKEIATDNFLDRFEPSWETEKESPFIGR